MKANQIITSAIIALTVLVGFTACKKENTVIAPITQAQPISSAMGGLFQQKQAPAQSFGLDATQGGTIRGMRGTIVDFQPNSFINANGQVVSGAIQLTLREVYDRTDMILSNRTTVADNGLLLSSGEVEILAYQNGGRLSMAPGASYALYIQSIGAAAQTMNLYYPTLSASGENIWLDAGQPTEPTLFGTDTIGIDPPVDTMCFYIIDSLYPNIGMVYDTVYYPCSNNGGGGWEPPTPTVYDTLYSFFPSQLGWINADCLPYSNYLPVRVHLPTTHTYVEFTDTRVYMALSSVLAVGTVHQSFTDANLFEIDGQYFGVPSAFIGQTAHIVALHYANGRYYAALIPVTITAAGIEVTVTDAQLIELTPAQIQALLDGL